MLGRRRVFAEGGESLKYPDEMAVRAYMSPHKGRDQILLPCEQALGLLR
jgi:hypothetical protein